MARPSNQGAAFCKKGHELSEDNLYRVGKYKYCKQCRKDAHERYRATPKGKASAKIRDLKPNFWTLERFEFALKAQNNACDICKSSFDSFPKSPFSDHDHLTNDPRGLLCSGCNSGLGMFKDSPALLEYAAAYLRKYGK